jgi:hypothetical protein
VRAKAQRSNEVSLASGFRHFDSVQGCFPGKQLDCAPETTPPGFVMVYCRATLHAGESYAAIFYSKRHETPPRNFTKQAKNDT